MAGPVTPTRSLARRWWWLALVAAGIAVAVLVWPRHSDASQHPGRGGDRTADKAPPPWATGPFAKPLARRRLGPIAPLPPAAGLVRVTGAVTDVASHKPVPDVEVVFADGASEATATTDVAGRYSIDVPPGRYRPYVRGDGVMSAAAPVRERLPARPRPEQVQATRLELAAAVDLYASTDGVDLEVVRSGKIRGRVLDVAGHPIAGAIVRAFATDDLGTSRPVLGTDVAETDAAGGFELEVAATTYRLDAFHDRYGGVAAYTMASVTAGETTDADITMQAGCVIAGRVVRSDGRPVSDGALERAVSEADPGGNFFPDGEFGDDGLFVWSTSEEMTLYLRAWPWKSPPSEARRFECKDGARFDNVVFVIPNAAPDLSGRVVTADGRPVPFAFVDIGGESDGTMNQQERADADGNWAVYALPAGQYRVASTADGVGAVVTHTSAPSHDLELRMSGTGTLIGSVAGVTDGSVTLTAHACGLADDVVAIEFRRVISVAAGRYRLDGVPACQLNLQVEHGGRAVFLEAAVTAGGTTTLDLDFPDQRPVLVRGVVVDHDHHPVADASVVANGDGEPTAVQTDATGRFTLEARPGDTIVATGAAGYTSTMLPPHGPSTVELELTLEMAPDIIDEPAIDD